MKLRNAGDYGGTAHISRKEVEKAITAAEEFIKHESVAGATGVEAPHGECPACGGFIVVVRFGKFVRVSEYENWLEEVFSEVLVYPQTAGVRQLPQEVPSTLSSQFSEAERVLPMSANAVRP